MNGIPSIARKFTNGARRTVAAARRFSADVTALSIKTLSRRVDMHDVMNATLKLVLRLGFKRITAVLTTACFLVSFVFGEAVASIVQDRQETGQIEKILDDFVIPYTAGRVTDAGFFGSQAVVVAIQDLHCHPEVQRNIGKMLSLLDEKYDLSRVYIEGSAGQVDTSWLSSIKDKQVRQELVESLLKEGKLTGSEYYSVTAKRPDIILGLENEKLYNDNVARLNTLLKKQNEIAALLGDLRGEIQPLKNAYYNQSQRKLEESINRYKKGGLDAQKYYTLLKKYCDKLAIDVNEYRNIVAYLELIRLEKELNYKQVSRELQEFVMTLKQRLPFAAYNYLLEKTNNFTRLDEFYVYLSRISEDKSLVNLTDSLPHLSRFFEYINASQKINPLRLVQEEKKLTREIYTGLSANQSEREAVFVVDFSRYLDDYLSNRISAEDYAYFAQNIERYKLLWEKYTDNVKVARLNDYIAFTDEYYRVNVDRNEWFLKNIPSLAEGRNAGAD